MKAKSKFSYKKGYSLLIALTMIVYLNPYFVWETYYGGVFSVLRELMIYTSYFATIIQLVLIKNIKINKANLISIFMFIVLQLYMLLTGTKGKEISLGSILFVCYICMLILLDKEIKIYIVKYFSIIFAISLVFPIITWILLKLNISIPHDVIQPWEPIKIGNTYYNHYFLSVFRVEKWGRQLTYLNGIFDEQGLVGTIAGILLAIEGFKIKNNKKNIIIFLGGLLSFSMAFYLILIAGMFLNLNISFKKKLYVTLSIIVVIVVCFTVLKDTTFVNEFVTRFFKNGFNRYDDVFESFYINFKNGNINQYLFGLGENAFGIVNQNVNMDASTYKILIYNYGIIGFIGIIGWLLLYQMAYLKNYDIIAFMLIFILSIYQRPYVMTFTYLTIYICAKEYIINNSKIISRERIKSNENNGNIMYI